MIFPLQTRVGHGRSGRVWLDAGLVYLLLVSPLTCTRYMLGSPAGSFPVPWAPYCF